MLLGLLTLGIMAIAATTFFLVYDKEEKKESAVESDDSRVNNSDTVNDKRENSRSVANMSPLPTPTVVNQDREHYLNDVRKKENIRVNGR